MFKCAPPPPPPPPSRQPTCALLPWSPIHHSEPLGVEQLRGVNGAAHLETNKYPPFPSQKVTFNGPRRLDGRRRRALPVSSLPPTAGHLFFPPLVETRQAAICGASRLIAYWRSADNNLIRRSDLEEDNGEWRRGRDEMSHNGAINP